MLPDRKLSWPDRIGYLLIFLFLVFTALYLDVEAWR